MTHTVARTDGSPNDTLALQRPVRPRPEGPATEDITGLPPGVAPWVTVIVPTRNESDAVGPLLARLAPALGDMPAEVLFVDDSTDDTPDVVRTQGRTSGAAVRLLHRPAGARHGGLGGAVLAGMRAAHAPWAVVMDADLQHPPELVTRMVAIGQAREVDLVVGTRYTPGGRPDGLSNAYRKTVSSLTTRITKALFPRRLALISDPMSGFFAVRLAALDLDRLRPRGFKILLEIAVRQRRLRVAEVPFDFGERVAGQSKASLHEGLRFVRHIAELRLRVLRTQVATARTDINAHRWKRIQRMMLFALVGLSGVGVNEGVLWLMLQYTSRHYLIAAIVATESSTLWNFALTEWLVFRGPKPGTRGGRFIRFALLNHVALLLRLPVLAFLVETVGLGVLAGNLVTLVLLFAVRFLVADSAIYAVPEATNAEEATVRDPMRVVVHLPERSATPVPPDSSAASNGANGSSGSSGSDESTAPTPAAAPAPAPLVRRSPKPGHAYLPYRYAVGSVLTIGSQVELPELDYFRAQWVGKDVDLVIRVDQVGKGRPRGRALMTQFANPPALTYQEHLGRLGANFEVHIGSPIEVISSPALAKSPHVLYTNVIEALLRFISVSRGVVLLHSACLELFGSGLLLSARTDTGKTGTVLRLLRDHGALFLSDDMTLVHESGKVHCFPKPLTISQHTLRAVEAGDLTPAEWRRLKLQSRLHSKEGRQFGMVLAGMNIPIMGINSITQRVVPPPKYAVDRLVDCRVTDTTTVRDLFVIERGSPSLTDIGFDDMIDTLITNTDDAYGFPPFRQLAPSIVIGGADYLALRAKERELLTRAMVGVRARQLSSDTFGWCDEIARLLSDRRHGAATSTAELAAVADQAV